MLQNAPQEYRPGATNMGSGVAGASNSSPLNNSSGIANTSAVPRASGKYRPQDFGAPWWFPTPTIDIGSFFNPGRRNDGWRSPREMAVDKRNKYHNERARAKAKHDKQVRQNNAWQAKQEKQYKQNVKKSAARTRKVGPTPGRTYEEARERELNQRRRNRKEGRNARADMSVSPANRLLRFGRADKRSAWTRRRLMAPGDRPWYGPGAYPWSGNS